MRSRPGGRRPLRVSLETDRLAPGNGQTLVLILLGAGILLGIFHRRTERAHATDPTLALVRTLLFPFQRSTDLVVAGFGGTFEWLFQARALRDETLRLRHEVEALRLELERRRGVDAEATRLRAALNFARSQSSPPLPAEVIGWLPSPYAQTVTLARGTRGGVRGGMIAVTADGLVGRVTTADAFTSQVRLLTDLESGVGALVLRDGKPQASGILQGSGRDEPLRLEYLRLEDDIKVGDQVITSGYGGVFPQGLRIGTVALVRNDTAHFTKTVRIRPHAAQPGTIQEVLVVPGPKPLP